jgi:hypothetical protein
VNIYFCRVLAKNNQRWPTCQVYIERKGHGWKKYNLEGSGSQTLGGGTHLLLYKGGRLAPGVAAPPREPISFHLVDLASTAFEDE